MLAIASVTSMILGAVATHVATRFPSNVAALETSAGVLVVGGLALLGAALPHML